jgi:tetratricopeptide (TPR) repeat protein
VRPAAWLVPLVLWTGGAGAFEFCDVPGKREEFQASLEPWKKRLREKRTDELEKQFGGLLKEHAAGKLNDQILQRWFEIFTCGDASCEPKIMEWLQKYPQSEAARLALAIYYMHQGQVARGSAFADKTSPAQFAAMAEWFAKSVAALDSADRVSKKPTLSAAVRIELTRNGRTFGPRPTEIYRKTTRDYPDSLQVRLEYVWASAPKWGGSLEQLASIVEDAKKALSAADARYIEYHVLQEVGGALEQSKRDQEAIEVYRRSIALCPGLDNSLTRMIRVQERLKDFPAIVASTSQYIERYPRDGWGYTMRGWALQEQRKDKEALADYEKATQLGYGRAFLYLGWFHEAGRATPVDFRRAFDLYMIAAGHGIEDARERAEKIRKGTGLPLK